VRELIGKAILVGISAIFGLFIGNEFYWVAGFPAWFAHTISLVATIAISWFLLSESKPRRR